MSRFTPIARRAAVAAVVLAALVPAAHATVPRDPATNDGTAVVLPEALRADRPSGPLASGAPGAVQAAAGADRVQFHAIPTAADAGDRAPGRVRTPAPVAADAGDRVHKPVPQSADARDRVRTPAPVSADAPDRVPVAQAPADDGGLSLPTVLLVALLAAAASVGIAMLLRRGLRGAGTANPSGR